MKRLLALVGQRIGIDRRAHQRQPEHIALGAVPVLRIVEQRHAEARLAHVDEAVRRHLELRLVPDRVVVRRAPDDAVGMLERRVGRPHRDRRQRAQQAMPVAPVDRRLDLEAAAVAPKPIDLRHGRLAEPPHDPDPDIVARRSEELAGFDRGHLDARLRVVVLEVPGVPVARLVAGIDPELVAPARQRLAAASPCGQGSRSCRPCR